MKASFIASVFKNFISKQYVMQIMNFLKDNTKCFVTR